MDPEPESEFYIKGKVSFLKDQSLVTKDDHDVLNTQDVGWSALQHEGDANIGFEFESYYVKMELEGVEGSHGVDVKEVLFRDHGFDLTADSKSSFYDLEAVTMPFPSDSGRTWCETAVRIRDVFETMRKRLQDSVNKMLEKEKPLLAQGYESYKVNLVSRKLLKEEKLENHPVAKAIFPSPIAMGIESKYKEETKLSIIKKYGLLGRPQFTMSIRKDRLLRFFMDRDGIRDSPLMRSIFHNLSGEYVTVIKRTDPTLLLRVAQVMKVVATFRPQEENIVQIEGETFVLSAEHDDLKAFLFGLRLTLLKMHVSQRKDLYLKAYFSVMFRTSLVAWWKAVNKPSGFTLEHASKIVCDSDRMGMRMNHGFYYDFLHGQYLPHDFDQNENEILLDSRVRPKQIIKALKRNDIGIIQEDDSVGIYKVTSFPLSEPIPAGMSVEMKLASTKRKVRLVCFDW